MAGTPALRPTAKRFSPILLHLSFGKAFVRLLSVYQKQQAPSITSYGSARGLLSLGRDGCFRI
jgi:hypothetical protein